MDRAWGVEGVGCGRGMGCGGRGVWTGHGVWRAWGVDGAYRWGGGDLVGRKFGLGNLAFQVGRKISHAKSRRFLLCPPVPLCCACSMSYSLFLLPPNFPQPN